MKLSFTTLGCPDWSFDKIIDEAFRMGFKGIEIRGVDGKLRADEIMRFLPENAESTKSILREKGLELIGFGASSTFHNVAAYGAGLDEARAAVDVCARLAMPFVRVFGDRIENESERGEVLERVAKGIGALCDYAVDFNVDILLEIHGSFNTLENVMPIVEGMKSRNNFGILWDIAHSDRTYADNWQMFYNEIKPYVKHIHIKDHIRGDGEFKLCLTGEGDIPIRDIIETLEKDDYTGWYSLEWEKKWHPELPEPEVALPGYFNYMSSILNHIQQPV